MDTEALRWFQQVADGETVTEVADVYGVSQPGVSRALARLDAEVGTPLLRRQGRLLRTTHAGSVFKRHVDAVLHGLDDGLAAVSELVDPETGTVTVAFQLSLGTWLVPGLVSGFRRAHPSVGFRLAQSHDALGSSLVAGGRVDLELTARRPRNPDVHWQRLMTQPLLLAVPPGHALAEAVGAGLADVSDEPFIALDPSWELRQQADALCEAAGFTPHVAFEGDDISVVLGFVAAGLGVAIVPGAGPRPESLAALVPVTDAGASREVGLAWSQTRRLLPSAELFRRYVLDAA